MILPRDVRTMRIEDALGARFGTGSEGLSLFPSLLLPVSVSPPLLAVSVSPPLLALLPVSLPAPL